MARGVCYSFLFAFVVTQTVAKDELNVHGKKLQTCSQPGTAMTGFTRDGRCADVGPADRGAHHVCIQMKADFCHVTGQPNWCTTRDFPCMGQAGNCKIGNWCVCQWAFSRYLARAGGCDSIVDLVCEATHIAALEAYNRSSVPEHVAALDCIKTRCGLNEQKADAQIDGFVKVDVDGNRILSTLASEEDVPLSKSPTNDSCELSAGSGKTLVCSQ